MPVQTRSSKASSASSRGGGNLPYRTSSPETISSTLTPQQYLQRMLDFHQMDLQRLVICFNMPIIVIHIVFSRRYCIS